ncbi:cytochrome P450 [Kutzneria sp. NPDC052558]|uniref:cytochrome P450/oxidoreductase n=1 Tax=Kutzneria sp. NPDC052558 TaxID=3364121 RepID=UPI0037CA57ED
MDIVAELDLDPYPTYARLRRDAPVAWMPWARSYFVTRWDDVRALADPTIYSAAVHDSPVTATLGPNLLHSEGERHRELRAPLTASLRPAAIAARVRTVVERVVDEALDRLDPEVDLIADYAQPLAIRVLTEVTGLPPVAPATLLRWLDGLAAGVSNYERDPAKARLAAEANREVDAMLELQLRDGVPDGSILAALLATPVDGRPITFAHLAATVKLLIIGGMQEPRDLFGFAVGHYLRRPDVRDRLREDQAESGPLIEEALRWGSPLGTVTRRTTRPVTLSDVDIPAGAMVVGVISSANRDERHWDNPDDFDLDRPDFQHLAFFTGAHACVGASLARLEARLAVTALIDRFDDVKLLAPITVRGWEFRGPVSIPVALGRRATRRPTTSNARALRVGRAETVTPDVRLLTLESVDGQPLPTVEPGAHIDVEIAGDATRQYSLTGDHWQIAVRRQPGGHGSEWLHDHVKAGDMLRIGGPRNNFRLVDAPAHVFIAGGIGITPIVPMVARLRRDGRPWRLHYLARSVAEMPFRDVLDGPETTLWPTGTVGRPALDELVKDLPDGAAVYCCGPASLLDEIEQRRLSGEGVWSRLTLRVERFAPRQRRRTDASADKPFDVELRRSGRSVHVPAGCSLLDALQEAGVLAPSTCRAGTCGSCETSVLEGAVEHRDSVLSPDERARDDTMMVCVSRARSPRLVLDL